jgi:hypothetical protein
MGAAHFEALRVGFDPTVRLAFHGAKVSSDGGLLPTATSTRRWD